MINIIAVRHLTTKNEWNLVWENDDDFGIVHIDEEAAHRLIVLNPAQKIAQGSVELWPFIKSDSLGG